MTDLAAARPHPPSSRRIVEARASGHVPQAPLAGFAFGLLALLACATTLGPRSWQLCRALLREPVALAAAGSPVAAHARVSVLLSQLLVQVCSALGIVAVSIALGLLLVQGPAFARLSSHSSRSFARLSVSFTASLLWCIGLVLISALLVSRWRELTRETLPSALGSWAQQVALLSVGALVIDAAFARARFFASLWLTRREHDDELREAFGAPELRAARQQARHADRQPPEVSA